MGFPSIKSSYAYIWWLGLLRVVQALKVIIPPLPLSAGGMCCPPLIFKPSLGRREIYRPVPPPSLITPSLHQLREDGEKLTLYYFL